MPGPTLEMKAGETTSFWWNYPGVNAATPPPILFAQAASAPRLIKIDPFLDPPPVNNPVSCSISSVEASTRRRVCDEFDYQYLVTVTNQGAEAMQVVVQFAVLPIAL